MRKATAILAGSLFFMFVLAACGGKSKGVGTACESPSDCDGNLCLSGLSFPSGYCSESCGNDGDCPTGSVCIADSNGAPTGVTAVCYLGCSSAGDCRSGYTCLEHQGQTVCVTSSQ